MQFFVTNLEKITKVVAKYEFMMNGKLENICEVRDESMYVALVAFLGPHAAQIQLEKVGIFPTEPDAEIAIEDFIESVLEIERPGYTGLVKKIFPISKIEYA